MGGEEAWHDNTRQQGRCYLSPVDAGRCCLPACTMHPTLLPAQAQPFSPHFADEEQRLKGLGHAPKALERVWAGIRTCACCLLSLTSGGPLGSTGVPLPTRWVRTEFPYPHTDQSFPLAQAAGTACFILPQPWFPLTRLEGLDHGSE